MALQKQITNLRTGHANEYWRLLQIIASKSARDALPPAVLP